ncbi:MAG TPA: hexose kinase [Bryobacteraceae bacterium]|nr:hexose kinase [Bryobacteraceae bacterium]
MIITLTINPSIDRNVFVDRLVFEDRAYILSRSDSAGGRGINASRVLQCYGAKTLAIATSGGANGEKFEKLLAKLGFPTKLVRINREIRTNFTVTDRQGLAVKMNEPGPLITPEELKSIEKTVDSRLDGASWLMLCGSIPPGVASDFYTKLIRRARDRKVKTLLDTDGDALLHGVEAGPTVVTPNQPEAERLLNRALITRAHFVEAVTRIKAMGAESVLLSLGGRGVVAINENQLMEVLPPRIDAVSPLGAGDALAAAYVWASTKKKDFADSVRWGVAAGTASARLPGLEFANLEQTKEIYKSVEVRITR